eukprot:1379687-Amorphochlora_amoeboformis.AAC.1
MSNKFSGTPRTPKVPNSERNLKKSTSPKKRLGPGDFEFGDLLGEGSYAKVFLATSKTTKKKYAAKIVDKAHVIKHKKVEAVMQEKKTLSICKHPSIVHLHCAFQDEHSFYFVLEFVPGGELFELIQRMGKLPKPVARFYGAEIINVLEYLHGKGILHRDLKPENLLLAEDRHLKLTDFGTAGVIHMSQSMKLSGMREKAMSCVGTAEYVSPEVLDGKKQTAACDLWSAACLIYQMITGKPPFRGASEYLIFQQILSAKFDFPADMPLDAKDLITKMLVVDPGKRLSIPEIKAHPFFSAIDWKNLVTSPAPTWKEPQQPTLNVSSQILPVSGAGTPPSGNKSPKGESKESNSNNTTQEGTPWQQFLIRNERVVFTGLIQKRSFSGVGFFSKTRQLILTSFPRILYVDPKEMTLRGEIPWSDNIVAEIKNRKNFVLHTKGKQYNICCLSHQADAWIEAFKK